MAAKLASDWASEPAPNRRGSAANVFWTFLRLGLTSFGGPIAHFSYIFAECVEKQRWIDEKTYADLVALCQFVPGPASSQLGFALGLRRAGLLGGLAAFIGFTAPSAALMIFFALGLSHFGQDLAAAPWLSGLKIVAVAVVAEACRTMAVALCPDRRRKTLALLAAALLLAWPSAFAQIAAIGLGAAFGRLFPAAAAAPKAAPLAMTGHRGALCAAGVFVALLAALPALAALTGCRALALAAAFYRSGALVFGGGHVVIQLLEQAVVAPGWIDDNLFTAGYGAVQAVPGPLFSFAAFLGAAMPQAPSGVLGGLLCLLAIYLPSFLLILAALPFWSALRDYAPAQAALQGVNAAVVGMLVAALYHPVFTSAIHSAPDAALALLAFLLLSIWRAPAWLVVVFGALAASLAACL